MSISGALSNAMSGLRAAGRASEIVGSNISNALTPGYGVRRLALSSDRTGDYGGVSIDGIVRQVDPQLLSDRRFASAEFASRTQTTSFLDRVERLLGTPDQGASLAGRLSNFENSLITAASRPEANERLDAAVTAARDLANVLNAASDGIQQARTEADRSIANQVTRLNDALVEVETLNRRIVANQVQGQDAASLLDHRQALLDEISEIVPVRLDPRADGSVAVYSVGGAVLIDGSASELTFNPVNLVTPYMTMGAGTLSGLEINGFPVDSTPEKGVLRGGTLMAAFEVRDVLAVEAQTELDAVARDLIERFEDPAVDPTLLPGDPGLFTDAGIAFDPLDEQGLASRISINAQVDPTQGGEVWRIRDGLGAVAPGAAGDARLLQSLTGALNAARVPASGGFGSGAFAATELTAALLSKVGADRLHADQRLSFSQTQLQELQQLELAGGVDTDAELQNLILIEQAYAANARVIETADQMIQQLLRI